MNQKTLKELLYYNPKTGVFIWKESRGGIKKGDIAGSINYGYVQIQLNRKIYRAHRLAWLYTYGHWPSEVDHINRNRKDNRIKNLREVSHSENALNTGIWSNNTSGIKGVSWSKQSKKWHTYITKEGKRTNLGFFNTKKEAAKVRQKAEEKYALNC